MMRLLIAGGAPLVAIVLIGAGMSTPVVNPAASQGVNPPPFSLAAGTPLTPYPGASTGCVVADPSGTGGCVTGAMAWLMGAVTARFGPGPVACWRPHDVLATSDHPMGRACDYTIGRIGTYPAPVLVARGWELASWLRANAPALHVHYVIFQGRIWSLEHDGQGWRPYNGAGVYNPASVTGGHYDHVHVSTLD